MLKLEWSPVEVDLGDLTPEDVLFVGLGSSAVAWYRCFLPAIFMGADWIGLAGDPPNVSFQTGIVRRKTQMARFNDYKVIVIQQPRGQRWLAAIRQMQERGIKVVYEVDDYLHAIRKMGADHDYSPDFGKAGLKQLELTMRVCDALICSTDFIGHRYRRFNQRTYVCENGLDVGRYNVTRPPRDTVNIGWAGATGHEKAATPWLREVLRVLRARKETCFVSIGQPFAEGFIPYVGPTRAFPIPWTMIECYPAAMTMFDIAIAPAGKGNFFRGKSDLRWLEAGALGIPCVADPVTYPYIEHGVNGLHAATPEEARELVLELVDDAKLRTAIGKSAREYVFEHRDFRKAVHQWAEVIRDVSSGAGLPDAA